MIKFIFVYFYFLYVFYYLFPPPLFFFSYITIASASMAVFRSLHIQNNTIGMVPVHGYSNNTNYSVDAIRWLDFLANKRGLDIKHALNGYGEKKVGGISVDGYCDETKTVFQYHVSSILFSLKYLCLFNFFFVL